jgi:hypothetical protein
LDITTALYLAKRETFIRVLVPVLPTNFKNISKI